MKTTRDGGIRISRAEWAALEHGRRAWPNLKTWQAFTATEDLHAVVRQLVDYCCVANGRARERVVNWVQLVDAVGAVADAVRHLRITWAACDGVTWDVDVHAQRFPHAYKFTPMSSHVRVRRSGGSWRVSVVRDACGADDRPHVVGTMPDAMLDAIRANW